MNIKADKKVLLITINGLMTEKDSISYIEELKMNIRKINPVEYSFAADLRELKTSPQNLINLMKKSIEIIASAEFKKRYIIMPESIIASSQLKRVGQENDKFIFVKSYNEVLESIA
jgi:hypothetical protein